MNGSEDMYITSRMSQYKGMLLHIFKLNVTFKQRGDYFLFSVCSKCNVTTQKLQNT